MDNAYANTVRLLLAITPDVFDNTIFAMKGGTAINLFVRDMPRLSVDIDVVYTPREHTRERALAAITAELNAIAARVAKLGLNARTIASKDMGDTKCVIENMTSQVKVEVNVVFRGTVLPTQRRVLSAPTAQMFSAELTVPVLATDELYGSKLVAAMDRQHPRDLFDVWQLYESEGLTDAAVECFVTYLAGHNRPIHEVLFGHEKDIAREFTNNFVGMTTQPVALDILLATRTRLRAELPERLTDRHRRFLKGLARARPDWDLLDCKHAAELPALRWKLANLHTFAQRRPADFDAQATELERWLR
jgi:predicted nucleotidyltransferase component of viral defense system